MEKELKTIRLDSWGNGMYFIKEGNRRLFFSEAVYDDVVNSLFEWVSSGEMQDK